MSELSERRWAVTSERGVEASGVAYNEASQLVRRLKAKVSGLCIITSEAAHRLSSEQKSSGETLPAEAVPQK